MTGLFDNLSARFASGHQPAIRPRPLARFQGEIPDSGFVEEVTENTLAPPRPQPAPDGRVRKDPPPTARPAQPAVAETTPPPADTAARSRKSAMPPDEPEISPGPHPPEQVRGPAIDPMQPAPEPYAPMRAAEGDDQPAPVAQAAPLHTHSETRHEVRNETRFEQQVLQPPLQARMPTAPAQPEAIAIPTEPPAPQTTIRIGRIEVRQPLAPVPTPATAAAAPPRNGAVGPRSPMHRTGHVNGRPSGLTDYLGWKRR